MTGSDHGPEGRDDGPPTAPQPVVPPLPTEPMRHDDDKMSGLRKAGYALLVVAVLAALVPIIGLAASSGDDPQRASNTAASASSAAKTTTTTKKTTEKKPDKKPEKSKPRKPKSSEAAQGPVIDPESNERANSEKTRSKLVVGAIAAGLAVFVFWGRRVRGQRRRKIEARAKGGK